MTDVYIETCTIHDDVNLTPHEMHVPGSEGGSAYGVTGKSYQCGGGFALGVRNDNRFVVWRIVGNRLELIEHSLATRLNANCKRVTFRDVTLIPRVFMHKSGEIGATFSLNILFATTARLYRISLPFNKIVYSILFIFKHIIYLQLFTSYN